MHAIGGTFRHSTVKLKVGVIRKTLKMKKISFILCLVAVLTACKKDASVLDEKPENTKELLSESEEQDIVINTQFMSLEAVQNIAQSLTNEEQTGSIEDEDQIREIVMPLIENGRQIHEEILSQVQETAEWQELSEEEREAILNYTEYQFAELSVIYSMTQGDAEEVAKVDWNHVRSCLSGAFGLGDIYYLVVENPRALMNASSAVKILKHVGARYLGWIGLGLAIWDFVDCVS